jgi:hypothetical protein
MIMLTIARERVDEPVEILKNDFPSLIEESRKATFSFAMVARKKFENLQVRFNVLSLRTLKYGDTFDPRRKFNTSDTAEDVLANIVKLSWLENETALLGIEPEIYNQTIWLDGVASRLLLVDYSYILEQLSGRNSILGNPLTYGAIIDENGESYYLEGESDFFFTPQANIISLSTSHNAEEQNYLPDDQIWEGSNRLPLSEAPQGGVLEYAGVDKDDTFTVIFTIEADSGSLPPGFGSVTSPTKKDLSMLQIVRIYLDGELFSEPIINIVKGRRR